MHVHEDRMGINKGVAIERVFAGVAYDLIIAAGHDKTDEDMFRRLARLSNAYAIKVGNDASFAKYNLHTLAMGEVLLQNMAQYALPYAR